MEMDYKKMFEKLAEQIRRETTWAKEDADKYKLVEQPSAKICKQHKEAIEEYGKAKYALGVKRGYEMVLGLVEKLEQDGDF